MLCSIESGCIDKLLVNWAKKNFDNEHLCQAHSIKGTKGNYRQKGNKGKRSKTRKGSGGFMLVHRTGKGQFSFQFQRKAMPKNAQTTAQLHSSHTLVK